MPLRTPPFISAETVTRRSVVDWLGKASVLALSGKALAACAAANTGLDGGFDPEGEAGADPEGGAGPEADGDSGGGFGFEPGPGQHEVHDAWPVRTVDRQDLEQILASWRLEIDGLVGGSVSLSFAELVGLARVDQVTDFHCVEGWTVEDVPWNGTRLSTLIEHAGGARPGATHVSFHTVGAAYNESLPLEVALEPRSILGYGVAGRSLPLQHGFPARVVVPRLLGYKNAKYVQRIELSDGPLVGYWVRAGYPYDGLVPEGRLRPGRF